MQAGLYLMATRGSAAPEIRICYERAESLCHSLNRPVLLYSALMGQWRYSLMNDKLTANATDCEAGSLIGSGAEQLRNNDRSLSGFGIDALRFGASFEDRATNTRSVVFRYGARGALQYNAEDLGRSRCRLFVLRKRYASGMWGEIASLPSDHGESDLTSEGAE